MRITVDVERIALLKEIRDLQDIKASVIREVDVARNELADVRAAKNQVMSERSAIEQKIPTLSSILSAMQDQVAKGNVDFYRLTDSQYKIIEGLNNEIVKKVKTWEEYEEKLKQIIDIDAINAKHKEQIAANQKELLQIEGQLVRSRREHDRLTKENNEFTAYKIEEEKKISARHKSLDTRQKKIDAYRKLLEGKQK